MSKFQQKMWIFCELPIEIFQIMSYILVKELDVSVKKSKELVDYRLETVYISGGPHGAE